VTRGLAIALSLTLTAGCDWYLGGENDPPPQLPDASIVDAAIRADAPAACLDESERTQDCAIDLVLDVVDFTTGTPDGDATIILDVTTGWDTIPPFPLGCPPLDSFVVPTSGIVDVPDVRCDSPQHPPILLLLLDDAPAALDRIAPTAFDRRLTCADVPASDCGLLDATIPVLARSVERDWRMQMLDDGMPEADTRGLVIMQYNEADGTPAAGVAPTIYDVGGERYLEPGAEVRFVAGDRLSLVRSDALMTGISGLAIIAIPSDVSLIGARRADAVWNATGVFTSDGWIFYEDLRPAP
jgi:hypothetical protein